MAFKQIYLSAAIPYRLPSEWDGIPSGVGIGSLYNGYLVTPPRLYAEEMHFPLGLVTTLDPKVTSDSSINLIGMTSRIYWPGYELMLWKVDPNTGAFISRKPLPAGINTLYLTTITQAYGGTLWGAKTIGVIEEYDPDTFELLQSFDAAHFGRTQTQMPLVDKTNDIVMMPTESGQGGITVYTLSTGTVLRSISLSGAPASICAEDSTRAYVLDSNNILNLVNYVTGEVISAYRCPVPAGAYYTMIAWDRLLRRLLVYSQVANASDGSSQDVIRGFYPIPVPTHLTKPIPLRPPRRGRQIPVLLKAVGDTGEPLAGVMPQLGVTGNGLLAGVPAGTDGNGESIANVLCVSAGSMTLTASASVDD